MPGPMVGLMRDDRAFRLATIDRQTASRPFDKDRDGFLMGEGAGMLILSSLEHAQARGTNIFM